MRTVLCRIVDVIAEQASGINEKRRGLRRTFRLEEDSNIDLVLVEFRNRLGILKNRLSEYVKQTQRGEVIVVTDRGKPMARLEPLDPAGTAAWPERAAQWRVAWQGGKPRGLPLDASPVLGPKEALARAVEEDR